MNGLGALGTRVFSTESCVFLPRAARPAAEWQGLLDAIPLSADLAAAVLPKTTGEQRGLSPKIGQLRARAFHLHILYIKGR
jgi:hypothetical protein